MNLEYSNIVWILDAVLVALILFLCLMGFLYSFAAAKRRGRERGYTELRNLFGGLDPKNAGTIRQAVAMASERLSANQWMGLINQRDSAIPEDVWPHVADFLRASPIPSKMEQLAERGRGKWHRVEAIRSIGILHTPAALTILEKNLDDEDEDIRYYSMLSLARVRTDAAALILLRLLGRGAFSGQKIVSLLEAFPPSITPHVCKAIEGADEKTLFWLLKLLSRFKVDKAHQCIEKFTRSPSPDVRAAACECLGNSGGLESRDTLLRCLKDDVWYVRLQAVRALARVCGKDCIPSLIAMMAEETSRPVQDSVQNVLMSDEEGSLAAVQAILSSAGQSVKEWHIDALIGSNSVVKILAHCLAGQSDEKARATAILEKLIRSGLHFGLKESLDRFEPRARGRLLEIVAGVDKDLAARMDAEPRGDI